MKEKSLPVDKIRRFLEAGPIVLVSSAYEGSRTIMTMGWHLVMEFRPSLIGCYIWSANHSFEMIRRSKECVVNIPEVKLAPKVVGIGNTFGREIDKFAKFGLTAEMGKKVKAPIMADALQAMNVDLSMHACPEIQPVRPRGGGGSRCCLAEISSDYALSG